MKRKEEYSQVDMLKITEKKERWISYFFTVGIICVFMIFFSSATSPIFDNFYGRDSAFYRFIGASVLKGQVPYTDIWDNKGPILFFIQAVGALHGTQNGKISLIFLMQLASLFAGILLIEQTDRFINSSQKHRAVRFSLLTVCALPVLAAYIQNGNLTEEWSLPFICCSLNLFARYCKGTRENGYAHPCKYAFIHGISLAVIAFIRINNSITLCAGLLVICIILLIKKQWKNLAGNIVFGLLGIAVITVPVFVYYLKKHALGEMLYASFIYNLNYAESYAHKSFSGHDIIVRFFPVLISFLLILINILRTRVIRLVDIITLFIVIANTVMLTVLNTYLHYYLILFPVYLLTLVLYVKKPRIPEVMLILAAFMIIWSDSKAVLLRNFHLNRTPMFLAANTYLPKAERGSMIAIDVDPSIYLIKGVTPCSRFAAFQHHILPINQEFEEEFTASIHSKNPLWIIKPKGDIPFGTIQDLLNEKYSIRFSESNFDFYRLNQAE